MNRFTLFTYSHPVVTQAVAAISAVQSLAIAESAEQEQELLDMASSALCEAKRQLERLSDEVTTAASEKGE